MSAGTYRKRPVEIEAIQWTGDNEDDVVVFVGVQTNSAGLKMPNFYVRHISKKGQLWVAANDAWLEIDDNEWVLKDSKGCYPCKADVFATTYDPVDSDDQFYEVHTPFLSAEFHCGLPGPQLSDGEQDALSELIGMTESVGMRLFRHWDPRGYADYCANATKVTPLFRDVPLPDHPEDDAAHRMARVITLKRNEKGMSRMDLHRAAGVTYPYLSEIELGNKYPKPDTLTQLALALETTSEELRRASMSMEGQ